MITPTIHLNGTSADVLERQYETAYRAMLAAAEALHHAAPNARDYYVQGPGASAVANEEHAARVAAVGQVVADLQALHQAVYDVRAERDERRRQRDAQR